MDQASRSAAPPAAIDMLVAMGFGRSDCEVCRPVPAQLARSRAEFVPARGLQSAYVSLDGDIDACATYLVRPLPRGHPPAMRVPWGRGRSLTAFPRLQLERQAERHAEFAQFDYFD